MSRDDQKKWDSRWRCRTGSSLQADLLIVDHAELLSGGLALDLACGMGQNAIWLAQHGYRVLGVDISMVALARARQNARNAGVERNVCFAQVDLDKWLPPAGQFDLICVFRFLERALFPAIENALRPNGLLFYATRNTGTLKHEPGANPDYLLLPGELRHAFRNMKVLCDSDDEGVSKLVARKASV